MTQLVLQLAVFLLERAQLIEEASSTALVGTQRAYEHFVDVLLILQFAHQRKAFFAVQQRTGRWVVAVLVLQAAQQLRFELLHLGVEGQVVQTQLVVDLPQLPEAVRGFQRLCFVFDAEAFPLGVVNLVLGKRALQEL